MITISNNGHIPTSFPSSRDGLRQTGFKCDMPERTVALPAGETMELLVKFDPSLLTVKDGVAKGSLFFNVSNVTCD